MAKRKQRVLAPKKTALKRGKARTKVKSDPRKAAKRASAKTRARKTAKRAGSKTKAKKAAKRVPVKTKAKKQAIKGRAKRAAPKKTAPRPTEPPRQPAEASDETVVVDIIEEPVPGVVVVTEFESVRTSRPEASNPQPEGEEDSGLAEREEDED
jgi:hypothetical protein